VSNPVQGKSIVAALPDEVDTPAAAIMPKKRVSDDDSGGMDFLTSMPRRWVVTYIPLGIFTFVLLFPFLWMGMTAFKPNAELLSRDGNPFWVKNPTLAHFKKLLFDTAYPDWLWNTLGP
jgi:multiple sugar transport system permease protein